MDSARQTIDFFGHQDRARARTRRFVIMYFVAVALICLVLAAVAALLVWTLGDVPSASRPGAALLAALAAAAVTGLLIGGGSAYRISELRAGGSAVAQGLGGRVIDPSTRDPDERRVLNVVEEMSIASGVPVPPVYMMPDEKGINAFAAGLTPGDAVIGVTRGCVTGLTRDELQGVMAHEFSHILNGDMRLNVKLIGLLYGIILISLLGHILLRASPYTGRNRNGGGAMLVLMVVAISMLVVGSLGALSARIIQAAVSRQREFLADASAVQFTRNPHGIGDALRRIGGSLAGARIHNPRSRESAHMFFAEALSSMSGSLASHPPLDERIRRVDPSWDGTMLPPLTPASRQAPKPPTPAQRLARATGMGGALGTDAGGTGVSPAEMGGAAMLPLLALSGTISQDHIDHARELIAKIPAPLRDAAHDTSSARAVIYALLLDRKDQRVRDRQIEHLSAHADPAIAALTGKLAPAAVSLDRALRLPLLDMTPGALAHLSPAQYTTFRDNTRALIKMDETVDLFEWVTTSMITRHLDHRFGLAGPVATQYYALGKLGPQVGTLLSAIAHAGSDNDDRARAAFDLGARAVPSAPARLLERGGYDLSDLDKALRTLASCSGKLKGELLRSAALVAGADRKITADEAELLRAVADTLGVPTPPLLAGQTLV